MILNINNFYTSILNRLSIKLILPIIIIRQIYIYIYIYISYYLYNLYKIYIYIYICLIIIIGNINVILNLFSMLV